MEVLGISKTITSLEGHSKSFAHCTVSWHLYNQYTGETYRTGENLYFGGRDETLLILLTRFLLGRLTAMSKGTSKGIQTETDFIW